LPGVGLTTDRLPRRSAWEAERTMTGRFSWRLPAAFAGRGLSFPFAGALEGAGWRPDGLTPALADCRSGRGLPVAFGGCAAGRGLTAPFGGRLSRSALLLARVGRATVRAWGLLLSVCFFCAGLVAGLAGRVTTLGLILALEGAAVLVGRIAALAAPARRARAAPGLVGRTTAGRAERPVAVLPGRFAADLSGRAACLGELCPIVAGRWPAFVVRRPEDACAILRSRN
jgi:hypothetical protein